MVIVHDVGAPEKKSVLAAVYAPSMNVRGWSMSDTVTEHSDSEPTGRVSVGRSFTEKERSPVYWPSARVLNSMY